MIFNLQQNVPMLIGTYAGVVVINVKQYGAGNLRLGTDRESLVQGINLAPGAIVDGIPQAVADGIKSWFWSGDLWVISDQSGPAMILAPAYQTYIAGRLNQPSRLPSDLPIDAAENDLSTYQ